MLQPSLQKNDRKAKLFIYTVSAIVFTAVVVLSRVKLTVNLGFDVHLFAMTNAIINTAVAVILVLALLAVKQKKFALHKNLMLFAIILSVFFLLSYICHHLFAGETKFGDLNGDGVLHPDEALEAGSMRMVYYFVLFTHIPLAGIILPFILFTAYRALIGEYEQHKKLTRITWPIWFYVAVTGVIVYIMISPYYK
jgi:putative membrane protein